MFQLQSLGSLTTSSLDSATLRVACSAEQLLHTQVANWWLSMWHTCIPTWFWLCNAKYRPHLWPPEPITPQQAGLWDLLISMSIQCSHRSLIQPIVSSRRHSCHLICFTLLGWTCQCQHQLLSQQWLLLHQWQHRRCLDHFSSAAKPWTEIYKHSRGLEQLCFKCKQNSCCLCRT